MRKGILCAVAKLAVGGSALLGQSGRQGAAALTVIRAGTLIDGGTESVQKNRLIFVRGERIEKVADGAAAIPGGTKVIGRSDAFGVSGLIEGHTANFLWGEDSAKGG